MNIWQLSNALNTETIELMKHDFQSDIIALINRKKMLDNELNFN